MNSIDLGKLSYEEIEKIYIDNNIQGHYKFQNEDEVKRVLGWDFRIITGFENLYEDDKKISKKLICNYLNGFGLSYRHKIRPKRIEKEERCFKVTFLDGYSYLYFDGTIG